MQFYILHLDQNNFIRRAARGRKVPLLKKAFEKYPQFEAVEVADVASGDFSTAFDGVGAIIHTAAPLPGRADGETALKVLGLPLPFYSHLTEITERR
jgi:hypothetical protein